MAREIRIEYPDAAYHVVARGNDGAAVFLEDQDREVFLRTLEEACAKTGWQIHAYVLMRNHYHLLMETPKPNLVAGMKWLQGTFTRRHHVRHRRHGHLFQGRYRAVPVQTDDRPYFSALSTYIHLNPVRSGLVRVGEQPLTSYPWSSYPAFAQPLDKIPIWLRTERVLRELGLDAQEPKDRQEYTKYIEKRAWEWGMDAGRREFEQQWREFRHGWCLGSREFRDRLLAEVGRIRRTYGSTSYLGGAKAAHEERAVEDCLADALSRLGLEESQMRLLPKGAPEKQVLAWWLRQRTTASRQWVASHLGMGDESRVTQSVRAVGMAEDGPIQRLRSLLERPALPEAGEHAEGGMLSVPEFLD
jgi:putative transposase